MSYGQSNEFYQKHFRNYDDIRGTVMTILIVIGPDKSFWNLKNHWKVALD